MDQTCDFFRASRTRLTCLGWPSNFKDLYFLMWAQIRLFVLVSEAGTPPQHWRTLMLFQEQNYGAPCVQNFVKSAVPFRQLKLNKISFFWPMFYKKTHNVHFQKPSKVTFAHWRPRTHFQEQNCGGQCTLWRCLVVPLSVCGQTGTCSSSEVNPIWTEERRSGLNAGLLFSLLSCVTHKSSEELHSVSISCEFSLSS